MDNQNRVIINENDGLNNFLSKLYGYMALAVGVSAITSFLTLTVFQESVFGFMAENRWSIWALFIVQLVVVLNINVKASRAPFVTFALLMGYSVLEGVTLSLIISMYSVGNIIAAFAASSAVFVTMTILGNVTKRDLTKLGTQALAALVGLIVASFVNLFLQSELINYVFSYVAVIIFTILTAWDTQKLRQIFLQRNSDVSVPNLAMTGALMLYLDFINLFISFLRIFGYGGRD
ncbi:MULTISPECIES: Bax inhibitor-1/YccA family protein [Dellaglioa]|uniref:Membrane protein n=2 Tax=Dellaglioa TaxID=2767880 RepID=A0A2C8EJV8_9LACO|nr:MULTISPECIES: Bax inhibitor-1/YccA family protein [Dellaglioa]MCZ2491115.1 Bax inhibitor-1/YccA family protein [Dellaglioa carnosa]MCZ2492761.1 Bax inhibitor-1/YccA family protein [Dellaglioa carnosa]MCZ2494193.1 Bax inhibitor-1/YccA family protein [Dellaglioa carnosa]MDK1716687.1 Bax inhibitor-1/YccA family protein [Dellaglioa algida]MDK1718505.1 Bax inhibitor-1/YccA family protein [Dellaglioa algida]